MKKLITFLIIGLFCLSSFGQKITALGEATEATTGSLTYIRQGASGDLIKKISIANLKVSIFSSPTLTGTVILPATTSIGNVSSTEIGYIDNLTSSAQGQINAKVNATDTAAMLSHYALTSEIPDAIDTTSLSNRIDLKANISHNQAQSTITALSDSLLARYTKTQSNTLLNLKANTASPTFTGTVTLPSGTAVGDVSSTEIGYVNNVTSAIQTQLNTKAPIDSAVFTSLITLPSAVSIPVLPEDYEPDTLLVWKNGRIYFTTKDKLSDVIYPVEEPYQEGTYFVSTDGNDANPGTFALPFRTWQKGFTTVTAGDTLVIRGGTYTGMYGIYGSNYYGVRVSGRDGTSSDTIKVWAYPGETPVLDCSSLAANTGIRYGILLTNCDYWHIKGLTVRNLIEYAANKTAYTGTGWEINDGTNIKLEQCVVTRSMNGFTVSGTVTALNYVNCDAHHNYDYYDDGGLANGFGGNMAAGSTIVFDGCRAWSNSDDGWDCYAGHGYITFNNCWAWRNGYDVPTRGNGDGFKVGPPVPNVEEEGAQRTITNCLSWDNYLMGFDESMDVTSSMDMVVYNNVAYRNNRDYGFRFSAAAGTGVTTLRNNIAYLNNVNYEGRARNVTDHNTWDAGAPTITAADFVSVDTTGVSGARGSDGSLPVLNFLKLAAGSDMIDAGVDVGIAYEGDAPDLGAFEKQ